MGKMRKIFAMFFAILTSVVVMYGVYGLGIWIAHATGVHSLGILVVFVDSFILIIFGINTSIAQNYKKLLDSRSGNELDAYVTRKKEESKTHTQARLGKVINSYREAYYNVVGIYVGQVVLIFMTGFAFNDLYMLPNDAIAWLLLIVSTAYITASALACAAIFYAIYSDILSYTEKDVKYASTYKFIKDIFVQEGIKSKVKIILIDDVNIGIAEDSTLCLSIGVQLLKFLTKDELRSIIYHEIAHLKHNDTKMMREKDKYHNRLTQILPYRMYYFIYPKMAIIEFDNIVSEEVLSLSIETNADDEVLHKNVGDDYASSAVKLFGLSLAYSKPRYDIEYMLCKDHKWTDETIAKYFDGYLDIYNKHEDFYKFASKHHLEEKITTHPNVRQRVEKFATHEVDTTIKPSNEFDDDIKIYFEEKNKLLKNENPATFDDFVKKYESYGQSKISAEQAHYQLDDVTAMSLMKKAFKFGDMAVAIKCANKILENHPKNLKAHYVLGINSAYYDFNDDCVGHLQLVISKKNTQYLSNAMNALQDYAAMTGKEELLNKLRALSTAAYDDLKDIENAMSIGSKDTLEPYSDEEIINNIVKLVKENEDVQSVTVGTKRTKNSYCHHVVLFVDPEGGIDKLNDIKSQIEAVVGLTDEQFGVLIVDTDKIPPLHPFKKKPLSIYAR